MRNRPKIPGWDIIRRRILERDGWRCRACGKAGRLEVDHIRSVYAKGSPTDPANLQALCRKCHLEKTRRENTVIPKRWDHRAKAQALIAELIE